MSSDQVTRIRTYFERLTTGDTQGIVALFADGAEVLSPFLGRVPVPEFFAKLDAASQDSKLTVHDVLLGTDGASGAAKFRYDWGLKDGSALSFEGVDYFTFAADGAFASMEIYHDTHPLRLEVGDKYA